jgi:hypothetical protein
VIRRLLPLLLVAFVAVASGCGGDAPTQEEFETQVQQTRDRTDGTLQNITTATSWDELLLRIRAAADETRAAAEQLDETGAPDGLEDEARELVISLRGLADELAATADALEEETTFDEQPVSGLDFAFWDRAQEALEALREQGVDVEPLARHRAPADEDAVTEG